MGAYEWYMQTKFGGAGSRYHNFTGQKWTILNRYILVISDYDENFFLDCYF